MACRTDTIYEISVVEPHCFYKAVSYHRNGTKGKSQWRITVDEEISVFVWSLATESFKEDKAWGLYLNGNTPQVIGVLENGEASYLGRFAGTNNEWHGYPGDYKRTRGDIPPFAILLDWTSQNYISKSSMLRIQRQLPCSL